jgi:catechol 2,3-dioxygenase-like lactoylglutathione lyase family enzyme
MGGSAFGKEAVRSSIRSSIGWLSCRVVWLGSSLGKRAFLMPILDHIGINVTDSPRSKEFYARALAPLGISLVMEFGSACGFGKNGKPELWIGSGKTSFQTPEQIAIITPVHVCLIAKDRSEVDAFYAAAIAAGGRDNGKPGLRPEYHANYYGAFVLDPDGHNIEAAVHS